MPGDLFSDSGHRYTPLLCFGERASHVLAILLCPLLLALPRFDVLTEYLLVEGTASALVPLHLRHKGSDHLETFRVLLPVVIACQVEPTEHLLPPVQRAVQVLHGSTEPEDDLVPAFALAFVGCPGAVLERMGFPIEAPKAVLVAISAEVVSASLPKAAHACLTSCSGTHRVERVERSGKEAGEERMKREQCPAALVVGVVERWWSWKEDSFQLRECKREGADHAEVYTAHTPAAPACPMHTLEGFALDDECCFFGRDEALLDSFVDLGDQHRVFATGTTRVTTKGVSCGMHMGSSIRTRKGCWCCFCIVCTPWTPALTMRSTREYGIIIVRTRGA